MTRKDFSWGHSDTQWQLPEVAAAWKIYGRGGALIIWFLQLNLQGNHAEGWFGFRSDRFSETAELWGWDPWESQAKENNGEARGEKLCTYCLPGRWDRYTEGETEVRGHAL